MRTKKVIVCLLATIVLIGFSISAAVVMDLFRANESDMTDESAYRLIEYYFGIDVRDTATITYKEYGTNIREEFFTIMIQSDNQGMAENYIEMSDSYIPVSDIVDTDFVTQIPAHIKRFYCLYQRDATGRWTHRILVGDDKETIIYDYDP